MIILTDKNDFIRRSSALYILRNNKRLVSLSLDLYDVEACFGLFVCFIFVFSVSWKNQSRSCNFRIETIVKSVIEITTYPPIYLPTYLPTLSTSLHTYILTYQHFFLPTYLPCLASLPLNFYTYLSTYLLTFLSTYLPIAYLLSYFRNYLPSHLIIYTFQNLPAYIMIPIHLSRVYSLYLG